MIFTAATAQASDLLVDVECPHGLEAAWCSICREQAGVRRHGDGDRFEGDCTVQAFTLLTGASYPEAVEALRSAGGLRKRTGGATVSHQIDAYESVGFTCKQVNIDIATAVALSRTQGRNFLVNGFRRTTGHAWAIVDGQQFNGWSHGFRYFVYEVA